MKIRTVLLFVILLSLIFVRTDSAFHGTGLICNKCHTIHYSEDNTIPPGADAGGPFKNLLIKQYSTELCLTCHDGVANMPDVYGADTNGLDERAGGFFGTIDTSNPNGHNLALDKLGSGFDLCMACHFGGVFNEAKIGCIDCHEPHGKDPGSASYRYRNVQWASDPGGEPIIKAAVNPSATAPPAGLGIYERVNIGYIAPTSSGSWREVTNICLDCHHIFSGYRYTFAGQPYTRKPANEDGVCYRHPNTDSERGAMESINKHTGGTDPTHWTGGTGIGFSIPPGRLPFIVSGATDYVQATTVADNNEVFCLTCHKAHGSENDSSMHWNYRNNSNAGCQQCHNKGS